MVLCLIYGSGRLGRAVGVATQCWQLWPDTFLGKFVSAAISFPAFASSPSPGLLHVFAFSALRSASIAVGVEDSSLEGHKKNNAFPLPRARAA